MKNGLKLKKPTISIIMPALNEEKNILLAIDNSLKALREFDVRGEIIVVNDGSTDSTPLLVEKKMAENPEIIRMISHDRPKGIGTSFWDGVDAAKGDFVVLGVGDNENDPREIFRYYDLLKQVDIVIPFIFNKEVRSFFRNILSFIFRSIINITFLTNFNYTNGTIIYRKSLLKELDHRSNGFFFQADILIRLTKRGYLFAEVPHKLSLRKEGASKLISLFSLWQVAREYLGLVRDYYFKKDKKRGQFLADSSTAIRRGNKVS